MSKESNLKKYYDDFVKGLKRLGRRNKELLLEKLEELDLTDTEFIIMQKRYIEGLSFKQILPFINVQDRRMFDLHKSAIKKAVEHSIHEYFRP